MNRFILSFILLFISVVFAPAAAVAQGLTVYNIVSPEYRLGSFRVHPPTGDGWRQVANSSTVLRLVYAETLDGGTDQATIHTRADIVAESFAIEDPSLVPNGLRLTLNGQTQMMEQRGDALLGYTRIDKVEAGVETHAYTLKSKIEGEKNRYETFFVSLAPDRSEYMVVKFTVDEEDYAKESFFKDFLESYKSLGYPDVEPFVEEDGDTESAPAPDDDSSPAPEAAP